MAQERELEREITIMQHHLKSLRRLAGWTAEELGKKLGITKQAVSALENNTSRMNQLHYLSLIYLFETETDRSPGNPALKEVLDLLFSDPAYYESKRDEIDRNVAEIATAIGGGTSEKTSSLLTKNLITPLLPIAAAAVGGVVVGMSIPFWKKKIEELGKKR